MIIFEIQLRRDHIKFKENKGEILIQKVYHEIRFFVKFYVELIVLFMHSIQDPVSLTCGNITLKRLFWNLFHFLLFPVNSPLVNFALPKNENECFFPLMILIYPEKILMILLKPRADTALIKA